MTKAEWSAKRSRLIASLLASAWRPDPSVADCSKEELELLTPLVIKTGAAALAWRRVRHSELKSSRAAVELHEAYRLYTLRAIICEREVARIFTFLRSHSIEPILVKGWAIARLYCEQGLRPSGDIDLCVCPEQFASAVSALKNLPEQYWVDLHCGFEKFGGGSFDEIYERSELVRLGEVDVRVPCAEDHLRVLCIHLLREGAWRPLWLCDVAVAVEARPANFDWDRCLGKNKRWSNWVISALRLAAELLATDLSGTPASENQKPLPRWLVRAILKEWESLEPSMAQRHRAPMASYQHIPKAFLQGLRHRWPNPIEATVSVGGRFNEWPRLPFQLGSYLARGAKFAIRLPKLLREY
jgi:Uncharacterised nucleotidyltransferase